MNKKDKKMYKYYLCELRKFLDKEEYKSLIDWLKEMSMSFFTKTHVPTCENSHLCPSSHPECETRLGIHTAILWQIGKFIQEMIFNSRPLRLSSIDDIRGFINFAKAIYYLHSEYLEYFIFVTSWKDKIDEKYKELLNKCEERFEKERRE